MRARDVTENSREIDKNPPARRRRRTEWGTIATGVAAGHRNATTRSLFL
jgi:hypothetical protein